MMTKTVSGHTKVPRFVAFMYAPSIQPRFYCRDEFLLIHILLLQRSHHVLIHRILADDMVDRYGLALSLPPESCIRLLIQFQAPGQAKPDQDVATLLDV